MKKIKVVTGKIGLDDHYRGIISVTDAMRNAGMEVVYLGTGQRIDGVINTLVQEDAEVIGLSFLCGGHIEIMTKFINKLKEANLDHIVSVIGGIIHPNEIPQLNEIGVTGVFLPGTPTKDIVEFVQKEVEQRRAIKQ
ncbi:MAG: cobalamin-dependent protein [Spirochaetota bacterium]|nr:cobalamin-dependent protein [Spirochaetota bacterium]